MVTAPDDTLIVTTHLKVDVAAYRSRCTVSLYTTEDVRSGSGCFAGDIQCYIYIAGYIAETAAGNQTGYTGRSGDNYIYITADRAGSAGRCAEIVTAYNPFMAAAGDFQLNIIYGGVQAAAEDALRAAAGYQNVGIAHSLTIATAIDVVAAAAFYFDPAAADCLIGRATIDVGVGLSIGYDRSGRYYAAYIIYSIAAGVFHRCAKVDGLAIAGSEIVHITDRHRGIAQGAIPNHRGIGRGIGTDCDRLHSVNGRIADGVTVNCNAVAEGQRY